ncbi:MAG: hypothetical protein AAF243_05985 [Cyanobacteria bacterium P01_A01_bin.137]
MSTPPPSKPGRNPETPLALLQEQQQAHQTQLNDLQKRVSQTWGLIQTLVAGLVIAILVTIGVSGWFAYRLLVQEQVLRRESEQTAQAEEDMLEQLEEMTAQLERQQRQLQTLRQNLTDELETIDSSIESNQRQLQTLKRQIEQQTVAPEPPAQEDDS